MCAHQRSELLKLGFLMSQFPAYTHGMAQFVSASTSESERLQTQATYQHRIARARNALPAMRGDGQDRRGDQNDTHDQQSVLGQIEPAAPAAAHHDASKASLALEYCFTQRTARSGAMSPRPRAARRPPARAPLCVHASCLPVLHIRTCTAVVHVPAYACRPPGACWNTVL